MDDQQAIALATEWRKALEKQMAEMKVRQWCVEQAIKQSGGMSRAEFQGIYTDILEFVSTPFSDIFKTDGTS